MNKTDSLQKTTVPLTVSGEKEHNGFLLSEPLIHSDNLIVLTGRNGCGKTRLLESINKNYSVVDLNGQSLTNQEITLVSQQGYTPNLGNNYNDAQYQNKVTSSIQLFDQIKEQFDSPRFLSDSNFLLDDSGEKSLSHKELYRLCLSIGRYLGKPASQLTHSELKMHFENPVSNLLGFHDISAICNQYIRRKNGNDYNQYRANKGDDVAFLSNDRFVERFGGKPWEIINEIIESTFDKKFKFSAPDETSESYSYNAVLIEQANERPLNVSALSSGERTLLWLALTLFNIQYYREREVKKPKLLLLDEPDAFLHPKMVVKLFRVLKSFYRTFNSRIFMTTHSPTTVALAPANSTYIVRDNSISQVTKDEGIAELLDGITHISIDPENRRQVFVESQYDANVYQSIFSNRLNCSNELDPKLSVNFVSSGPKMPEQHIKDKVQQVFEIDDEARLAKFVEALNGVGNCSQVVGQVEALRQRGNDTVRGIIDWDLRNKPSQFVSVLAYEHAYSIENIALDPICILLLLHTDQPDLFTMNEVCGKDVSWQMWLDDPYLLQESVDRFIRKVLCKENDKKGTLSYVSGQVLLSDSEYLRMKGHPLEDLVKEKFSRLKSHSRSGKNGELKYSIVKKSMITLTEGAFIPSAFEHVLSLVQR